MSVYIGKVLSLIQRPLRFFRASLQLYFNEHILLIIIALPVGATAGLASLALRISIGVLFEWLHHYCSTIQTFWVPGAGAALGWIFFSYIARDKGQHGVPEVIDSICHHGARLRFQACFSHLVASCLTIGSGGSAGPEAPVVISGAAIGSNIGTALRLNERHRMILLGAGAAGAISAIFNAPMAGMLFVAEILLADWSTKHFVPIAIASVAGNQISDLFLGNRIVFTHRHFDIGIADVLVAFVLALLCAVLAILFSRSLRRMHHFWERIPIPPWLKAGASGCLVGLIGYASPMVMGEGYHDIQSLIQTNFSVGISTICFFLIAKIVATSLTLGGGGSGGIFAPSLMIGALAGVAFQRCLVLWMPMIPWVEEGCFALLGMAGLISGILQAPLTGIMLIVEITGDYNVILPLIVVAVVSATICNTFEPASFYLKGLVETGRLHRPRTDERILSDLSLTELLENDCFTVPPEMLLRDFVRIVSESKRNYFPVIDTQNQSYCGIVNMDDIRWLLFDTALYDVVAVEQIMDKSGEVAQIGDSLKTVLQMMRGRQRFSIPVLSEKRFVGMISKATLLDYYRLELKTQTFF